jgi:DNA processing protein
VSTLTASLRESVTSELNEETELQWIALSLIPGLGPKKANDLLRAFDSPARIFAASKSEITAQGVSSSVVQSIASGLVFEEAVTQRTKLQASGALLLTIQSRAYSSLLRNIYDPPIVLYAKGRVALLDRPSVAIVGTRNPSAYGKICSDRLGRDLAQVGVTVVSGMARGIDTAAHRAALEVGGDTIAVFGCGLDVIYPTENKQLARDISERGLILSEFPFGTPGYPQNFPLRNRIVSGLSSGTVIIEGAQYSGSAITAKLAMDQGRDIFAVPGNITAKQSWGPNLLIKQGAKLVQSAQDILEELPEKDRILLASERMQASDQPQQQRLGLDLGPMQPVALGILANLTFDQPVHVDFLSERLAGRASTSEILATILELELAGIVKQMAGRNFVKVWGVELTDGQ